MNKYLILSVILGLLILGIILQYALYEPDIKDINTCNDMCELGNTTYKDVLISQEQNLGICICNDNKRFTYFKG